MISMERESFCVRLDRFPRCLTSEAAFINYKIYWGGSSNGRAACCFSVTMDVRLIPAPLQSI